MRVESGCRQQNPKSKGTHVSMRKIRRTVFKAPVFCNTLSSVTFTINGVGSGTVTDGLSIFDATVGTLGLERTTGGLVDWIDHDAIEFQTFNLARSLGPITVAPRTPQVAVATTAGSLNVGNLTLAITPGEG
jgi:hypothetical protein